ncbi:MAG: hypothetical protein WBP12_00675 [Candidatus Saccharimonas sp.]
MKTYEQDEVTQDPLSKIESLSMRGMLVGVGRQLTENELRTLDDTTRTRYAAAVELDKKMTSIDSIADVVIGAYKEQAELGVNFHEASSLDVTKAVEAALAKCVGTEDTHTLTTEYMSARKQFVHTLIRKLQEHRLSEDEPHKPATLRLADQLSFGLLGQSPNLMDYVGGSSDSLEVLADLSTMPELRSIYTRQLGGVVYDLSFTRDTNAIFSSLIDGKSTAEQLTNIRLLEDITDYAVVGAGYESAEELPGRIYEFIAQHDDKDMSWMSSRAMTALANHIMVGEDDVDDLADAIRQDDAKFSEQVHLSGQFQRGFTPTHLAKDTVGARSEYGLIEGLTSMQGSENGLIPVGLREYLREQGISATDDDVTLFQELQHPALKGYMEWQLGGIRLEDIPLAAQFQLVKFAGTRSSADFERLTEVCARKLTSAERQPFLEAFLSAEFGDDYGEMVLSIAEHAPPDQTRDILQTINQFREHSAKIARWYAEYDPELARATEMAMNERLTDALYAIEELARSGKLEVDVAPHRNNPDYENDGRFMMKLESLESGMEVLHALEKSLELQHTVITSPDVSVSRVVDEDTEQFMIYRFSSAEHGDALLYIRPEGAKGYDRDFEYGNRRGVEASISFIVNPTDPHHLRSDKDPHGVSIRFDREGRIVGESPFSEDRDPTRLDGIISLDISSELGDGRYTPVKIGRLIAAGNILRAERIGTEISLHHNTNYLDQQVYGNRGGFAKLAVYVAHMAEAMIAIQQQGVHNSRYRKLPGILRHADYDLVG